MQKIKECLKTRKFFWTIDMVLFALLIFIDQLVKNYVRNNIMVGKSKQVISGLIDVTNLENTGAAWSFLAGHSWIFEVIAFFAVGLIAYLIYYFRDNKWLVFGMTLVLAGTVGNLLDRIFIGFVTDMIQIKFVNFPVFNIADCCVTVGVLVLLVSILFGGDENAE